jgi:DNA ligase-1
MFNKFKPQLLPNDTVKVLDIDFTKGYYASTKLDGIRCCFINGELKTRSLKPFANKNVEVMFDNISKLSEKHGLVIDGELFCTSKPFNDISGDIRRIGGELPTDLKFYAFDCIVNQNPSMKFSDRLEYLKEFMKGFDNVVVLEHTEVTSPVQVDDMFKKALDIGMEGLVLRKMSSGYKFGRYTLNSRDAYKLKPWRTYDAKILDVYEGTLVNEDAEKTINELGRSVTSKKKDDRHASGMAKSFLVSYEKSFVDVSISSMTHEERISIWNNRDKYIGKMIEYKGLEVGAKDVPRHPIFIRFRDDLE